MITNTMINTRTPGGTAPWLQDDADEIHGSEKDDDMSWFMRGKAAYEGLNRTDPDAVWYVFD